MKSVTLTALFSNKTETKIGPGLQGFFHLKSMPSSGLSVSYANFRKQLKTPLQDMPSFSDLPDEDIEALSVHLKTLLGRLRFVPKVCHRAFAPDQKLHNTDFTAGKV